MQPSNEFFTQRRAAVAEQVRSLLSVRGPMRQDQKRTLDSLLREADDLERGVSAEFERRQSSALSTWLRRGDIDRNLLREERSVRFDVRDMGESGLASGAASGAGVLVPAGFNAIVDEAMKYTGPMLEVSDVADTDNGANRSYPADNDTGSSGEEIGEAQQVNLLDAQGLAQVVMGAYKFSSKVIRVSNELRNDAGFSLDGYLARKVGIRIGRILNQKTTVGSGSGEPTGFVTQCQNKSFLYTSQAAGNAVSLTDVSNLVQKVDPLYRSMDGRFMLHPNTLEIFRQQVDTEGQPIFRGLHNGGEDTIFNRPVSLNPYMDAWPTQASSPVRAYYPLAFGSWKSFRIRRAPSVLYRLDERFADFDQTGYMQLARFDSNLCDGGGGAIYLMRVNF